MSGHDDLARRSAAYQGFHAELEKTRALVRESARILRVAQRALQMYEANFAGAEADPAPAISLPAAVRVPAG